MANICPKCAKPLDADNYCNHCDISVSVYKSIKDNSKVLYNQGLQKAKVRDLSASIDLLNRSVRMNKNNTDARNLLGLIYFEIGETVAALQQWVISKNLNPDDNEAVYFLKQVQDNQSYLDKLNTAIKKYNQSLTYIEHGSIDLAIIHLKKVISLNPKYVKAYALLALCYIKDDHVDKAQKILFKVLTIDKSNYIARKYLDEISQDTVTSEDFQEKAITDHAGGMGPSPVRTKINGALFQFVAMAIGVAVGLSIMSFMVMPGRIDEKNSEINELTADLTKVESEIETLEAEAQTLNAEVEAAKVSGEGLSQDILEKEEQLKETVRVLNAMNLYVSGEEISAADNLFLVDSAILTADVSAIYESLTNAIYPTVAEDSHDAGYSAYQSAKYDEAIALLTSSYKYAKTSDFSSRTLYFLARSYYKKGEIETSIPIFQKILDDYPESRYITDASYFINLNTN